MLRLPAILIACAALLAAAAPAFAAPQLVRVVIVQRHGVRPPTQDNDALARYAAQPWPAWSAKTGELTPHGGATVFLVGQTVADVYRKAGVLPAGCAPDGQIYVWADNADERTRDSGRAFAAALEPGCGLGAHWSDATTRDPIFSVPDQGACAADPDRVRAAIAAAGGDPLVSAPLDAPLARLQAILGPDACAGGAGTCFASTTPTPGPNGAPTMFPYTSSLAEDLYLEYADNMPIGDVGWGRANAADIAEAMKIHEHAFALLRDDGYLAARRGAPMARVVLAALAGKPVGGGLQSGPDLKLLVLAGHDSNLAWISGLFGVRWSFPDNPDFTAPSTALAFELWSDGGRQYVRPVIYYESLDQLRTLKPDQAEIMPLKFDGCDSGPNGSCPLDQLTQHVLPQLPDDCGVL